jgi:antitoxin MazE
MASGRLRTRLIRIGNSRGVRLAKPLIAQAGLGDEVEVRIQGGAVVITPVRAPRTGWAEAVRRYGGAPLLDPPTPTRFDDEEWRWE